MSVNESSKCKMSPISDEQMQRSMRLFFDLMLEQFKRVLEEQKAVACKPQEAAVVAPE